MYMFINKLPSFKHFVFVERMWHHFCEVLLCPRRVPDAAFKRFTSVRQNVTKLFSVL